VDVGNGEKEEITDEDFCYACKVRLRYGGCEELNQLQHKPYKAEIKIYKCGRFKQASINEVNRYNV